MAKLWILCDRSHIHVIGNVLSSTDSGLARFGARKRRLIRRIPVYKCVLYGTDIATVSSHSHAYRDSKFEYRGVEEHIVRLLNRFVSSLLLVAALAAPTAIMAGPKPQDGNVQVRIYDRDHRDYHNWDDREDRAYRRYLAAQHRRYREYQRQHYRVQRHYWSWRHHNPDRD